MSARCPTCGQQRDDALVRSTPLAIDRESEWHANLAELIDLIRGVVVHDRRQAEARRRSQVRLAQRRLSARYREQGLTSKGKPRKIHVAHRRAA